jgi:hypothetical protein
MACNTSNLISHKPVTSSGVNYSWGTSVTNCCVELLVMNSCGELLRNQSLTAFIISAINCWSVRCHDICVLTDCYLVVTIPHCFGYRGYLAYRTVGSNLVVSVAWQWIFPACGNSAFQTTCHIIIILKHCDRPWHIVVGPIINRHVTEVLNALLITASHSSFTISYQVRSLNLHILTSFKKH